MASADLVAVSGTTDQSRLPSSGAGSSSLEVRSAHSEGGEPENASSKAPKGKRKRGSKDASGAATAQLLNGLSKQAKHALTSNAAWLANSVHPLGYASTLGLPVSGRKFLSRCFGQGALPHVSKGLDREDAVVAIRFARVRVPSGLEAGTRESGPSELFGDEGVPAAVVSGDWCRHFAVAALGEEALDGMPLDVEQLAPASSGIPSQTADGDAADSQAADTKQLDGSASTAMSSQEIASGMTAGSPAQVALAPSPGVLLPVRDMLLSFIAGLLGASQLGSGGSGGLS